LADLSVIASQLPGATEGLVLGHKPTFLKPYALKRDRVHIVLVRGNGFSRAQIDCTVRGKEGAICTASRMSDGRLRLELAEALLELATEEAAEIRRLDVALTLSRPTWWGFGAPERIEYKLPLFVLPQNPV
jgi:hypothetical protein